MKNAFPIEETIIFCLEMSRAIDHLKELGVDYDNINNYTLK
jgi:hypothetical protein